MNTDLSWWMIYSYFLSPLTTDYMIKVRAAMVPFGGRLGWKMVGGLGVVVRQRVVDAVTLCEMRRSARYTESRQSFVLSCHMHRRTPNQIGRWLWPWTGLSILTKIVHISYGRCIWYMYFFLFCFMCSGGGGRNILQGVPQVATISLGDLFYKYNGT